MVSGYREQPAPAALAGVVACLWRHEVGAAQEQRVLPDGCMDLISMNGSVYVAGPDTRAFLTTPNPGQVISGLRFRIALRLVTHGMPFAITAARAGYADQAHLAREVRALSGVQLGQLLNGANRSTLTPSGS
ncbi:MAG: DUF6597 domain-containing transcriptional factor [Pseudonocardiaceae bacterium]